MDVSNNKNNQTAKGYLTIAIFSMLVVIASNLWFWLSPTFKQNGAGIFIVFLFPIWIMFGVLSITFFAKAKSVPHSSNHPKNSNLSPKKALLIIVGLIALVLFVIFLVNLMQYFGI